MPRSLATAVLVLAALVLLAPSASGQPRPGKVGVYVPEPVQAGDWNGTWFYHTVDAKMVLWIRTTKGKPEVKLRYESGAKPVSFETDWNGDATYYLAEKTGTFQMRLNRRDANEIAGSWSWNTPFGAAERVEKGTFRMFRALDGRMLVIKFEEYLLEMARGGRPASVETPPVWTFNKASRREVLWDEIPF